MILRTTSSEQLQIVEIMNFDNKKIVRINKFIEEQDTEDGIQYVYDTSEFTIESNTIEDSIRANPMQYWEYVEVSQTDRIEAQVMYTALLTDTLLESEDVE